jgi:hypothetical protein
MKKLLPYALSALTAVTLSTAAMADPFPRGVYGHQTHENRVFGVTRPNNQAQTLHRQGVFARNTAHVRQHGRNHAAAVGQIGNGNSAFVGQTGNNTSVSVNQNGNGNISNVFVFNY